MSTPPQGPETSVSTPHGSPTSSAPRTRERVIGEGITWLSRWTLRWVVIALGAYLLGWIVAHVWSILLPVMLALVLATVLAPPARLLHERGSVPKTLAAAIVLLGSVAVVGVIGAVIVPTVAPQVTDLADSATMGLSDVRTFLRDGPFGVTQGQIDSLIKAAQDRLQSSASTIASGVLVGLGALTSALINLVLTLVLAFLFIKDGDRFLDWVHGLSGHRAGRHLGEVLRRSWAALSGFVRAQALVGLIDAVLIGIGLIVLGVPLALPLAVLTFIAAFAPIVGAVTIGVLSVLVALVANGWVTALIVLGLVLLVQQLEGNVFLPWLQGRSLQLHAAVVLLVIVLGSTLFGVVGAFLAVPVAAVVAVVLRYLDEVVSEQVAGGSPGRDAIDQSPGERAATEDDGEPATGS